MGHVVRHDRIISSIIQLTAIMDPLRFGFLVLALSGPSSANHPSAIPCPKLAVTVHAEIHFCLFSQHWIVAYQLPTVR